MKRYGRPQVIVTDHLRSYRFSLTLPSGVLLLFCSEWINQSPEGEAVALTSSRPFLMVSAHLARTLPNSLLLVPLVAL